MSQGAEAVDLEVALGHLLKQTDTALRAEMEAALRPLELTVPQYAVLELLHQRPGLSGSELARSAFVSRQSMNVLLLGLERQGLVRRNAASSGRALPARITAEGRRRLRPASRAVNKVEDRMSSRLDEAEQVRLRRLLNACLAGLRGDS
jgi:DNA-binding MarR family transcriptional regulator